MQRHREPLAATLASLAVFAGLVAPSLVLGLVVALVGTGLLALLLSASRADRTDSRRHMQNPH